MNLMDNNLIATLVVSIFFGVVSATLIWISERIARWQDVRRFKKACNAPWPDEPLARRNP